MKTGKKKFAKKGVAGIKERMLLLFQFTRNFFPPNSNYHMDIRRKRNSLSDIKRSGVAEKGESREH